MLLKSFLLYNYNILFFNQLYFYRLKKVFQKWKFVLMSILLKRKGRSSKMRPFDKICLSN